MSAGFERIDYDVPGLFESDLDPDPFRQFDRWFKEAAHLIESNTMILATADAAGRPSARAVLLKGFDERGLVFFTNHESSKGIQIAENPWAEACLLWMPLHRQVRVSGSVRRITAAESDAYWDTRPRDAQLAGAASRQSRPLRSRDALIQQITEISERYPAPLAVPRPDHWGGLRIEPEAIEFWQGQSSRLHDRLRYRRKPDGWIIERLSP